MRIFKLLFLLTLIFAAACGGPMPEELADSEDAVRRKNTVQLVTRAQRQIHQRIVQRHGAALPTDSLATFPDEAKDIACFDLPGTDKCACTGLNDCAFMLSNICATGTASCGIKDGTIGCVCDDATPVSP